MASTSAEPRKDHTTELLQKLTRIIDRYNDGSGSMRPRDLLNEVNGTMHDWYEDNEIKCQLCRHDPAVQFLKADDGRSYHVCTWCKP